MLADGAAGSATVAQVAGDGAVTDGTAHRRT